MLFGGFHPACLSIINKRCRCPEQRQATIRGLRLQLFSNNEWECKRPAQFGYQKLRTILGVPISLIQEGGTHPWDAKKRRTP